MTNSQQPVSNQRGFTIVELMIATSVLSVMLILVTIIMISIGNLYYKGINQARIQENVRNITTDVSNNLQLSNSIPQNKDTLAVGGGTISGVSAYCIGTTRYTYVIDAQIGHQIYAPSPPGPSGPNFQHILWRDTITSASNCYIADLRVPDPSHLTDVGGVDATNGAELIAPNSRLTSFTILPLSSPYGLSISVAYGDDDLLNHNGFSSTCMAITGNRFCSTARLTTTVVQRLTNNSF